MTTNIFLNAAFAAAMTLTPMAALAGDWVPLTLPPIPAAPQPSAPPIYIIPTPEPNGGVTINGAGGGYHGSITHQPHGYGFETNGGRVTTPNGRSFGGSMTTSPSGVTGGTISFGTRF
jgi:hypothetical protein